MPRRHHCQGLWGILSRLGPSLEAGAGLRGCRECLVRVAYGSAKGKRRALDEIMDDREAIRHAQTRQPLCGALAQGLGSVTDQGQPPGASDLAPLLHACLPRGIGAIVRHVCQQQLPRREVHAHQDHTFQAGFLHGPNALSSLTTRTPVLLPRSRRRQQRGLSRL